MAATAPTFGMDSEFLNWATSFLKCDAPAGKDARAPFADTSAMTMMPVQQAREAPAAAPTAPAPVEEPLSCPTCFVPSLDLPPDEHGGTVNLYGTTTPPTSQGTPVPAADADAGAAPALLPPPPPTLMEQAPAVLPPTHDTLEHEASSAHSSAGAPVPVPVPVSVATDDMDCPTCFVPSLDLPPDEFGVNVNLYGSATPATAPAAPPPPPSHGSDPANLADQYFDDLFNNVQLSPPAPVSPTLALVQRGRRVRKAQAVGTATGTTTTSPDPTSDDSDEAWHASSDPDVTPRARRNKGRRRAAAAKRPSRNLPPAAVKLLKDWMLSPQHFDHPYPTDEEKEQLAARGGITVKQLIIWFTNARKRLWVPMRKKQGKPIIGYSQYRALHKIRPAASNAAKSAAKRQCVAARPTPAPTPTPTPAPAPPAADAGCAAASDALPTVSTGDKDAASKKLAEMHEALERERLQLLRQLQSVQAQELALSQLMGKDASGSSVMGSNSEVGVSGGWL